MEAISCNETLPSTAMVHYRGRQIGRYCVRSVGRYSMLLRHGVISFPVGTILMVQVRRSSDAEAGDRDLKRLVAVVHYNSREGLLLRTLSSL